LQEGLDQEHDYKTYSFDQIAAILGLSQDKVITIANSVNLKLYEQAEALRKKERAFKEDRCALKELWSRVIQNDTEAVVMTERLGLIGFERTPEDVAVKHNMSVDEVKDIENRVYARLHMHKSLFADKGASES